MATVARPADVERVIEIIALAFATDPVWAVALARPDGRTDHYTAFWRPYVEGAMRHSSVYLAEGATAVAVWIPPGCDEMTESQEADALAVVDHSLPASSKPAMLKLWDRFTAARPELPQHHYLNFLATHPDHRGHGFGQQLLRENLNQFDAQGVPAYLESTNPANNHRYRRAGFSTFGSFASTFDSAPITTMWRPIGGVSE